MHDLVLMSPLTPLRHGPKRDPLTRNKVYHKHSLFHVHISFTCCSEDNKTIKIIRETYQLRHVQACSI